MDELGENLLLATNEQVCLLFDQHDALKVKEELGIRREDLLRYDSGSSATSSPNSSLTPSPQRDLSPPSCSSSSESCEEYLTINPTPLINVVNIDEDDDFEGRENVQGNNFNRGLMPDNMQSSSQSNDKQRKRKRINKVTFVGETNIMWEDYIPTENPVFLFQDNQIVNDFGMSVTHMDKTICPASDVPNTYILYKQNQFKLCCKLIGGLQEYSTVDAGSKFHSLSVILSGELLPLEGLYFHIYAVKHAGDKLDGLTPVPLHQAGPSRTKKEMKPVQPTHISNGSSLFAKLQFQSSTPAGKEFFFRIISCLVAKTAKGSHMLMAKISPKLIVRAQNPGRYAAGQDTHNSSVLSNNNNSNNNNNNNSNIHNINNIHNNNNIVHQIPPNFTILSNPISSTPNNCIPFIPPPPITSNSRSNSPTAHLSQQSIKRDNNNINNINNTNNSNTNNNINNSSIKLSSSMSNIGAGYTPHFSLSHPLSPQHEALSADNHLLSSISSISPSIPSSTPPPIPTSVPSSFSHQPIIHHHRPSPYQPQPYPTQPYSPSSSSTSSSSFVSSNSSSSHSSSSSSSSSSNFSPSPYGVSPSIHYASTPILPSAAASLSQSLSHSHSLTQSVDPSRPPPVYNNPPPQSAPQGAWLSGPNDVSYHFGRVGINTSIPPEALTVQGNILVTGDLLKPSDRRLKRNLRTVNSAAQLASIENIKIYDYEVRTDDKGNFKNERGVIAQELKDVLPHAVETITPLHTDLGESMYIVNDRVLLIESLGATKQLDKIVKQEQATLQYVNKKVKELEEQESRNASAISRSVQSMVDIILSEDFRETSENECLYCGTSILGLGPAWTIFIIGFFFFPSWLLGTLYLGSKMNSKKMAGLANFLMLCSLVLVFVSFVFYGDDVVPRLLAAVVILMVVGILLVYTISYFRDRRKRLEQSVWKRLRKLGDQAKAQPPSPSLSPSLSSPSPSTSPLPSPSSSPVPSPSSSLSSTPPPILPSPSPPNLSSSLSSVLNRARSPPPATPPASRPTTPPLSPSSSPPSL